MVSGAVWAEVQRRRRECGEGAGGGAAGVLGLGTGGHTRAYIIARRRVVGRGVGREERRHERAFALLALQIYANSLMVALLIAEAWNSAGSNTGATAALLGGF